MPWEAAAAAQSRETPQLRIYEHHAGTAASQVPHCFSRGLNLPGKVAFAWFQGNVSGDSQLEPGSDWEVGQSADCNEPCAAAGFTPGERLHLRVPIQQNIPLAVNQ